jgi:GNAT superfamily N-acetyltransferase
MPADTSRQPVIRAAHPNDHDAVVALALRAWEPVYASVNGVLGPELALALHGEDWRDHQTRVTRDCLEDDAARAWVAEVGGALAGFATAAVVEQRRRIGQVVIVAADPAVQRRGVGTALVEHAGRWLREEGMRVAVIATGGDPGHAPARALYESLGYRPLIGVQYFRTLA